MPRIVSQPAATALQQQVYLLVKRISILTDRCDRQDSLLQKLMGAAAATPAATPARTPSPSPLMKAEEPPSDSDSDFENLVVLDAYDGKKEA